MSYEIIYDKQFIKLSNDKFIPIVLGGSNNCTEMSPKGRERRARSWDSFSFSDSRIATLEQMLSNANDLKERLIKSNNENTYKTEDFDNYNDSRFGWFCGLSIGSSGTSKTTFKMYQNLFLLGCKNALTVEEMKDLNISVRVFSSPYGKDELIEGGLTSFSEYFNTSHELETFIVEKEKLFSDNKTNVPIYVTISMGEQTLFWHRKIKRQNEAKIVNSEKTTIEISEAYVIELTVGFFHKRTKRGFKSSNFSPKYWNTEKEVKAVMNRLKKDGYIMQFNPTYKLRTLPYKINIKV